MKTGKILIALIFVCLALGAAVVVCIAGVVIVGSRMTPTPHARAIASPLTPTILIEASIPIPTSSPTVIPTETSTLTPELPAPPFKEIRSEMEIMTDAQWMKYTEQLKGTRVANWTGWIEDVNEKTFGGYELWIDMDSPDAVLSLYEISFDIPEDLALGFRKDQAVTFSGRIESIRKGIFGECRIQLVNATVE